MKALLLPAAQLMLAYRLSHWLVANPLTVPLSQIVYLISRVIFASDIHPRAKIGKNTHFAHHFNIAIGPTAVVGEGCKIFNGVTLGDDGKQANACPTVGDHVLLGTGAKIIGPIKIGSHSVVGANSVVIKDIPPYSLAVGVPATVKRTIDRDDYY
mgnify:CR=1 FL=1